MTNPIDRILALVKARVNPKEKRKWINAVAKLGGKILESDLQYAVAEFTGDESHVQDILKTLKPFGILEFEQTGHIAIERGKKVINV